MAEHISWGFRRAKYIWVIEQAEWPEWLDIGLVLHFSLFMDRDGVEVGYIKKRYFLAGQSV